MLVPLHELARGSTQEWVHNLNYAKYASTDIELINRVCNLILWISRAEFRAGRRLIEVSHRKGSHLEKGVGTIRSHM